MSETRADKANNQIEFVRSNINILVAGHDNFRLNSIKESNLEKTWETLHALLDSFSEKVGKKQLRIFTGLTDGTDAQTVKWAVSQTNIEVNCVAATSTLTDKFIEEAGVKPEDTAKFKIVAINDDLPYVYDGEGASESNTGSTLNPLAISATDNFKVMMADIVVAVWDGDEARGPLGGTVRVLAEALMRRKPVVWIKPGVSSEVSFYDPFTASSLALSLIDPIIPSAMYKFFEARVAVSCAVDKTFGAVKKMEDEANQKGGYKILLNNSYDYRTKKKFTGLWYTLFFKVFAFREWKLLKKKTEESKSVFGRFQWPKTYTEYTSGLDSKNYLETEDGKGTSFWEHFGRLDRVATYAAESYRNQVILTQLFAAMAVLSAVAGSIHFVFGHGVWSVAELIVLSFILFLLFTDRARKLGKIKDVWLHTRQAAEILRLSGLLYPYLSGVPDIRYEIWRDEKSGLKLIHPARWFSLQLVRNSDVPKNFDFDEKDKGNGTYLLNHEFENGDPDNNLIEVLTGFIDGQIGYHQSNSKKYSSVFENITTWSKLFFGMAIVVVLLHLYDVTIEHFIEDEHSIFVHIAHFIGHQEWLLFVTAGFPALAAALHSISSSLELKRLADNSKNMESKLSSLCDEISSLEKEKLSEENKPKKVLIFRQYAIKTAEIIYSEHAAWADLMEASELEV